MTFTAFRYTRKEKTYKSVSKAQILNSAKFILDNMKIKGICLDAVRDLDDHTLLTIEEANTYIERIVDDSVYYG